MKKQIDLDGRDCSGCLVYKTWDNYQPSKHSKTGYLARCNDCYKPKKGPEKRKPRPLPPLEGFSQAMQNFYLGQI